MSLHLHFFHFDCDLFNEIQPFLLNVVESIEIILPETFNSLNIKDICNKCAYELENDSDSVVCLVLLKK